MRRIKPWQWVLFVPIAVIWGAILSAPKQPKTAEQIAAEDALKAEQSAKSQAITECGYQARIRSKYPSSVNVIRSDSAVVLRENGDTLAAVAFEAKNDFGATLPYRALCLIAEDGTARSVEINNR